MEPQEQLVKGQSMTICIKAIIEAYLISKSIHDQAKEIKRFERSRKLLNKESRHEQYIYHKNETSIKNMEKATMELSNRLEKLDKDIITKTMDRLDKAVNCKANLDVSSILSDESELRKLVGMTQNMDDIQDMKQKIDVISDIKMDKGNNVQSEFDDADNTLRSLLRSNIEDVNDGAGQDINQVEELLQRNIQPTPDEYFDIVEDDSIHKVFGSWSKREIRKECDVEGIVKRSMIDDLGRKFVAHLLGINPTKKSVYPSNQDDNSIKSLQVRDSSAKVKKPENSKLKKTLITLSKMKNECDEMLLLCDSNLNSWSVRKLFDNLDYIDRITKNHKQVLETINNPWGEDFIQHKPQKEQAIPDKDKVIAIDDEGPEPPSQINLFPDNHFLSTIMAASLTEYTKQLYFSDLTQRVENLDKKLQ